MEITKEVLMAKKNELERERDQLLAEINLRIGAIQTVDAMMALLEEDEKTDLN